MVIVKISGGLGNQLFQFAFGAAIEDTFGYQVKFDLREYNNKGTRNFDLDKFVDDLKVATNEEIEAKFNVFQKIRFQVFHWLGFPFGLKGLKYYLERNFSFDENVFELSDDIYLSGYWQCEKYFKDHRLMILERIKIYDSNSSENMKYLKQIRESNSVSIHVRRGDYVSNSKANSVYSICDLNYYNQAIQHLSSQFQDLKFFVFSDDMDWVRNNFSKFVNIILVDVNFGDNAFEDLKLMSNCKHNIIANSTFSWWAAWLNQNSGKVVVAPNNWFNQKCRNTINLVPAEWHRI